MLNVPFLDKVIGVYNVGSWQIEARLWQAGAIILLVFMLLFTLARLRFLYIHWSLGKGSLSFLFYGFILAIILEGFLWVAGKTFLTEVLGWQNAPKPISTVLDIGREKMANVLGEEIKKSSLENIENDFKSLSSEDLEKLKTNFCKL